LNLEHGLAGQRILAVVGQRRGHDRQIPAGDVDRALTEIDIERLVRIALDHGAV
jgi:hypothetical protein